MRSRVAAPILRRRFYSVQQNAEPTAPSGVPLRRIFEPAFPLPLKESVSQWFKRNKLKNAESDLLSCVGLRPGAAQAPYEARSLDVEVEVPPNTVRGKQRLIMNELEVKNKALNHDRHIVLVHGYGAAKGFFYQNFRALADIGVLHALDWLGYGLSTRAKVKLPRYKDQKRGVLYAENWFVTALESWRAKRGVEKFTLVAHSLGSPIALSYAKQYPERVEKIVFVSPASVNRTKHSIKPEELYPNNEVQPAPITGGALNVPPWFNWLWERHYSPFFLVRVSGPLGPKLTSGWTSRRFKALPTPDRRALQVYTYAMFNAKGSGEYMLNYFLGAGSTSRWPLVERLNGLQCPSLWLYGDKDWMDVNAGFEAARRLRAMGLAAECEVVPNSGHHLYLDNTRVFDECVSDFLSTQ